MKSEMKQFEAQGFLQVGDRASPAEIDAAFRKRVEEVRKRFELAQRRRNRDDQIQCEKDVAKLKKARALLIDPPDPPPPPDPLSLQEVATGTVFAGRFELRRELGHGAMGVVWLAGDRTLQRDVALKFLPDLIAHDKVAANDLREETRRSIELSHPGIARVYDFVVDRGRVAISMEYIDGQTLSERRLRKSNHIFETRELVVWVRELCEALEYAHNRATLTHCDINPSNLMVNSKGHLQITDFGIAKRIPDSMVRLDPAQGTSGALTYMSPQQALGQKPNVTDDVYSVGATLYELLMSKPPFYKGEIWVQLKDHIPPTLAERRAELAIEGEPIPENWEETVAACLAKDPSQRPESAMKVVERLEKRSFPGPTVAREISPPPAEPVPAFADPPAKLVDPLAEPVPAPVGPSPGPVEPAPSPIHPAPSLVEPAPSPVEPAPSPVEPAPSLVEPAPSPIDPAPSPIDPAPPLISPAPSPIEPGPSPVDPALSPINPKLALIESAPSVIDRALAVIEPAPSPIDPTLAVIRRAPSSIEPALAVSEPALTPVIPAQASIHPTPSPNNKGAVLVSGFDGYRSTDSLKPSRLRKLHFPSGSSGTLDWQSEDSF